MLVYQRVPKAGHRPQGQTLQVPAARPPSHPLLHDTSQCTHFDGISQSCTCSWATETWQIRLVGIHIYIYTVYIYYVCIYIHTYVHTYIYIYSIYIYTVYIYTHISIPFITYCWFNDNQPMLLFWLEGSSVRNGNIQSRSVIQGVGCWSLRSWSLLGTAQLKKKTQ